LEQFVTAHLDNRLRGRVSPSDIVQGAFLEAHRDFAQFRGQSAREFVAWVHRITVNNILWEVEQHLLCEKRDVRREMSLNMTGARPNEATRRLEGVLAEKPDSPSDYVVRGERELQLADALAKLPTDYRDIIILRHIEELPFEEVARRMERSAGAVRMLWLRALKKLRNALGDRDLQ
jgi:RNA polymerase sigma-70 factor (ECF subfamily)